MPVPNCRSNQMPANAGKTISMEIAVMCEVHAIATATGERSSEESFTCGPINHRVIRAESNRATTVPQPHRAVNRLRERLSPFAYRLRQPANQTIFAACWKNQPSRSFFRCSWPGTGLGGQSISINRAAPPLDGSFRVISLMTFAPKT